ncbi:MAG: hypothetical protein M5U28_27575 [Sandaracinaceae bacterium]|nr:hypothetical protein [Sandaracinaceae bacterium]
MTPEQLTAIDRELDAFGKSADALRAVATRARDLAASLAGDEALSALLAEASTAAARAAERTRAQIAAAAPERPPISEHVPTPRPRRERQSDPAPAPAARKAKKAKKQPAPEVEAAPVAPPPEASLATDFDDEPATMVMTAATVAGQARRTPRPRARRTSRG